MRPVAPITPAEFFHLLQRCVPPVGWPQRLSVANSGGPDSTALLYLLTATAQNRVGFQERTPLHNDGLFHNVASIHVNHDLQAISSTMEETAVKNSRAFGAQSVVERILWGRAPFPPQPEDGITGEKVAREARYHRLFGAMQWLKSNVIAFAHHADDQVETAIMRMSQGSSSRGLAGMRPVRRWGMGQRDNQLYSFGANGMRTWIVRPFLQVPKDRLLATCEANGLDYVNDPTNFQPALTIRNAIRKALSYQEEPYKAVSSDTPMFNIASHVDTLRAMTPNVPPKEQLREAIRLFGMQLEEVEAQVTEILMRARLPSPPSTLLLASSALARVTDSTLRTELIRRCLRYVSPGPWGSLWAEGHGDRDTYRRIANELWRPFDVFRERRTFTAGAGVVVTPVAIRKDPTLGAVRFRSAPKKDEAEGWLLTRAEPYMKGQKPDLATTVDVTDALVHALKNPRGRGGYSTLYDHRFFVDFELNRMPRDIAVEIIAQGATVTIRPDTKWFLPSVILSGDSDSREIGRFFWRMDGWQPPKKSPINDPWIKMKFVRTLDAT